jgi:Flp pilus assembly protein TadD
MKRNLGLLAVWALSLPAAETEWVGSKVCAGCHAEIYRKYSVTPMAQTSGPATASPVPDQSFSGNNGYLYSITHKGNRLFLNFRKSNTPTGNQRELAWFAGSGNAARSYLLQQDNFLYEAPATYYTKTKAWSLSPGYDRYSYPFLTRAIAPGCLQCHATGVQPIAGTQNGYKSPPFLEAGIGCERCHGPGSGHAASANPKDIVNPAALQPEQRDGICAQCHLSGEIRVDRAGKSMSDFTPGDKLSDYTTAFVRASSSRSMKVTSHVENLAQSACSRASGTRFWCGTCHDPHFVPSATEKAAWFRSKCQTCHAPAVCQRGGNCIACHMPTSSVTDADHVVYTDHSIPRRRTARNLKPPADAPLIAFENSAPASPRDLGLAYAIVALREQNATYSERAFDLLREANRRTPNDPQTLSYLADLYKTRKDDATAAQLYQQLLNADPTQSSAPMNLGAYHMEQGHYEQAVALFNQALRISPALVLVRMNLAVALIESGHPAEARATLEKALEFNPAFTAAQSLLNQLPK